MRVGKLDRIIKLYRPDDLNRDNLDNQSVSEWELVDKIWAGVDVFPRGEIKNSDQRVSVVNRHFEIRYREDITETWEIEYKSEKHQIIAIKEIKSGRNNRLHIVAVKKDNQ